jgi:uncharacterized HAD superfamily protein
MEDIYKCDSSVILERVIEFYNSHEHAAALPISGSVAVLQSLLQKGYVLDVVTSRPETVREQTHSWIQKFFPDTFRNLHFTNGFGAHTSAHKRTKSEICHEIGATVLIEDALTHATEVAAAGIPVLMPDRPWNRSETPKGVFRIKNYQEIHDWIVTRAQ